MPLLRGHSPDTQPRLLPKGNWDSGDRVRLIISTLNLGGKGNLLLLQKNNPNISYTGAALTPAQKLHRAFYFLSGYSVSRTTALLFLLTRKGRKFHN